MKTWIFILLVAVVDGVANQQEPKPPPIETDVSKIAIENRAERLVGATRVPPVEELVEIVEEAPLDRSKIVIESATESLVETTRDVEAQFEGANRPPAPADPPAVVSVKPGLVNWYQDLATAQAASTESGKPVLLFQLLGKLDEHFT